MNGPGSTAEGLRSFGIALSLGSWRLLLAIGTAAAGACAAWRLWARALLVLASCLPAAVSMLVYLPVIGRYRDLVLVAIVPWDRMTLSTSVAGVLASGSRPLLVLWIGLLAGVAALLSVRSVGEWRTDKPGSRLRDTRRRGGARRSDTGQSLLSLPRLQLPLSWDRGLDHAARHSGRRRVTHCTVCPCEKTHDRGGGRARTDAETDRAGASIGAPSVDRARSGITAAGMAAPRLPPAPGSEYRWNSNAYVQAWAIQVADYLRAHAANARPVPLLVQNHARSPGESGGDSSPVVSPLENEGLILFEGWRQGG